MKQFICFFLVIKLFFMTSVFSSAEELNIVDFLEGRWMHRVIDASGDDVHEPNVVEYKKTSSGSRLISELGKSFTIFNYDTETKLFLMIECAFVMGSPRTSYLVGRHNKEKNLIEWHENNIRGMRKMIWKIANFKKIIIVMDEIWVKKQIEISNATSIPKDTTSEIELIYSMERLTE